MHGMLDSGDALAVLFCFLLIFMCYNCLTVKSSILTGSRLHFVRFLFCQACDLRDLLFFVFSECEDKLVVGCCCDSPLVRE